MKRYFLFALLALVLGIACSQTETVPATQLLITVRSELGPDVASVDVQVFDEIEKRMGMLVPIPKAPPFSFAMVPARDQPLQSNLIVLTARDVAGDVLAVNKAKVSFVKQKLVAIELRFLQLCRGVSCEQGTTCVASSGAGLCSEIPSVTGIPRDDFKPGNEDMMTIDMTDDDGGAGGQADGSTVGGSPSGGNPSGGTPSEGGTAAGGTTAGGTTAGGTTAGGTTAGGTTAGGTTGGGDGGMGDGGMGDGGMGDGGMMASPDSGPPPECDQSHPCSSGYTCTASKCVSRCATTQCDPNASCALVSGAPTCTCKNGYTAAPSTGGAVMCLMNQTCAAAGCSPNASCALNAQNQAVCTCNAGYTGSDGKVCTPVSCPALTVTNGTVETNGGTYGQTATYTCSTGYEKTGGSTRRCEANGSWSGTASTCVGHDCGPAPAPTRGSVSTTGGTRYGATASFSCSTGFTLSPQNATRMCTASGWSGSTPACIGCGDGEVQTGSGEQCDWANPIQNPWTCTTSCQRTGMYAACYLPTDCGSGLDCFMGTCTAACPAGGLCPRLSSRATSGSTTCWSSFGCFVGCTSTSQCPPGNICGPDGICQGCNPSVTNQCPSGTLCIGESQDFGLGRCQ